MHLSIDGVRLVNESHLWVPLDKSVAITCVALESRPKVDLSWVINDYDNITMETNITTDDNVTYTSTSTLYHVPSRQVETISCIAHGVASTSYRKNVTLFSHGVPQLYLTINGQNASNEYYVKLGENLIVTCLAVGGTPPAELLFIERTRDVSDLMPKETPPTISFRMTKDFPEPEDLTCNSIQHLHETEWKTTLVVTLKIIEETIVITTSQTPTAWTEYAVASSGGADYLQWMSPSIAALCILFLCSYILIMKIKNSMSANLPVTADPSEQSQLQMENLTQSDTGQLPLEKNLQPSLREKQKSELPSIPNDENNSINSSGSESNYYCAAKEGSKKDRVFSEKDFCLLISLKTGAIHNRWMGTIAISKTVNKCAVLTTISDSVVEEKVIHWEAFVKRTLDLPKTEHLTNIEGIGVDKTTLYLITEHVVCETLDNRLTFDPSLKGSQTLISVPEAMKHISGLLEGMELIISYGFLHPGLSSRKVLYTKEGTCKLYDFCLAEDAPKIVTYKKAEQNNPLNLNQYPVETLFRNEYTSESDVWSTAVVIWEILSNGSPPFTEENELIPGQDMETPKLSWPQRYLQLRNLSLFECWNQDSSLRPSIHHLRASFKQIFETLIENSMYEIPLSSLYTPMGGVAKTSPEETT